MNIQTFRKNFFGHLSTINRHKWMVMKSCFRLGLYKQGLLHDLSKYTPVELIAGIKYFQGNKSPNNIQRLKEGCSRAWLHHKGRNKHHFEYWVDYPLKGEKTGLVGMEMPVKYVAEMFCDRIAASKTYNPQTYNDRYPLEYFLKGQSGHIMNEKTWELLHGLLIMLAEKGEDYTFAYIRKTILKR